MTGRTYRASGVDLDAAACVKDLFKPHLRSTFGPQVMSDVGLFGGLFRLQGYRDPVLVASTDGVGTKLKLAVWLDRFDTLGHDVVNQSVNDVLTTGARPLFFLDYIAVETLVPHQLEALVKGMAGACRQAGCALLGGETAQLSGTFREGSFELAGFIVGAAEREPCWGLLPYGRETRSWPYSPAGCTPTATPWYAPFSTWSKTLRH